MELSIYEYACILLTILSIIITCASRDRVQVYLHPAKVFHIIRINYITELFESDIL